MFEKKNIHAVANNTTQNDATNDIQWIMNAYINLCVSNRKCPQEYEAPPPAALFKGKEKENGGCKMITGMRGGKARVLRTIADKDPHLLLH